MPWRNGPGAGFTEPRTRPWLPIGNAATRNVEDQRRDPTSTLSFVRDLLAIRRQALDLQSGDYRQLEAQSGAWSWQRGTGTTVSINLSDRAVRIPGIAGRILIDTGRSRDGEQVNGELQLDAWEGAVCSSASM